MPVINETRALRVANEAGISGASATEVEGVITLDQVISAGVEEELAMGAFKDHQMQNISLVSDQDVDVQFLGVRYAVLQTVSGPPGTITHTGDLTQEIFEGDLVRLEDMPTAGDDGIYMVNAIAFGAGTTTITLENGQDIPTAGGGAVGTVARVASLQILGYAYGVLTTVAGTGVITVTGDVTDKFAAGDALVISGSVANDGYWVIDSVTETGGVTTLIVNGGTLPASSGVSGQFVRVGAGFSLAANEPMLWSINGGTQNPFIHPEVNPSDGLLYNTFRGDVAHCMVDNAGATNANFDGRIGTNAIIF